MTTTRKNIVELAAGQLVDIVFYRDDGEGGRIDPSPPERFVFEGLEITRSNVDKRVIASATFRSQDGHDTWQAYIYEGDWAYGSSAERFDVLEAGTP